MPASITEYVPQFASGGESPRRRRALLAWGAISVGALALVGAIALAPVMLANGWTAAGQVLYQSFHAVCHQMPERSFYIGSHPLAVCARCAGLYAGTAAGALCYPLLRSLARTDAPAREWLFLAVLPSAIDFGLGVTGLWENTHLSRFLTALLLGAAAAFYIVPGFVDLFSRGVRQVLGNLSVMDRGREEDSHFG